MNLTGIVSAVTGGGWVTKFCFILAVLYFVAMAIVQANPKWGINLPDGIGKALLGSGLVNLHSDVTASGPQTPKP